MTKVRPKQSNKDGDSISYASLFRYASKKDYLLMFLGCIGAAADGVSMPMIALLLGDAVDSFAPGNSPDDVVDAAGTIAWQFAVMGAVVFFCAYIGYAFWTIVGEQQNIEIRKRYFKSLLSQEIAFFDSINPNEFSSKIADECFNIQRGIGDKVPNFISSIACIVAGFIIGYIRGWQLALVMTIIVPIHTLASGALVLSIQKLTKINIEAYIKAGAISEEVLNAIRTVVSLGGQEKETKRYQDILAENERSILKCSIVSSVAMGVAFLSMFGAYALACFIGSIFIEHRVEITSGNYYTAGIVLSVFLAIQMASFSPGRATPSIKAFAIAKEAGAKAFKIIERKSQISIEDKRGLKPTSIEGNIHFRDVTFAYPLKAERTILNGISFDIRKNEKTALVGESGCGKTTCLQLIERFYDIENGNGSIKLDGNELKDLNLKWMRENIGYVGQEPVLFATSIKENLMMAKENATDAEVWDALKKANAADFVEHLPDKLNTFVGTNGAMLSGGQKQRLAIARAILKNPRILLLDEATSALDRKNEMEIQKTLDEISEGRTTIVIAHRLSTIINADHIVVFDQGKVVEEGRHDELVAKKGRYYALQHLQLQTEEKEKQKEAEEKEEEEVAEMKPIERNQRVSSKQQSQNKENVHSEQVQVVVENSQSVKKAQDKKWSNFQVIKRLYKYNKDDIHLIFVGIIAALAQGAVFPIVGGLLMAEMFEVFSLSDAPDFKNKSDNLSLWFFIMAIISLFGHALQMGCFSIVAEKLSRRVRTDVFKKYVRMPIGWYDKPENSPGALGSKLSTDATLLNTLTGSVFGLICQAMSALVTGMVIGFVASWQLTLVMLAILPLKIISGKMRAKSQTSFLQGNDDAYQAGASFVSEAVNNMRTVASFGKEDKLLKNYSDKLDIPLRVAVKNGHKSGAAFGLGQFLDYVTNAVALIVGAVFIRDIGLGYKDMFQSIFAIFYASMCIGNALIFAPDIGAAFRSAVNIFKILDTKPAIDIDDPNQTVRTPIKGNIEFKNVWFKYPGREKQIFKGLNLKINASNKVALVGPSGCGKSTILALLQRFYDVDQGELLVDGINIKKYDLKHLRESFGVVSQEPVLFNGTIEYNIKYSKGNATDEEMRQAAIKASAIGFIEKNEFDVAGSDGAIAKEGTGFQRKVGPKGSQMSGGQKQRIAIARAILKNPSFLILDEATSALDTENEKIVQASLDGIMEGKTSLIVAHRISTIKDADEIIVFSDGQILERGNYKQLTEMQGVFYKLERGLNVGA